MNTYNHTITQEAEAYITKLQNQITAIQQIKNSNVVNFVDNDILKQLHKMEYDANRYKANLKSPLLVWKKPVKALLQML